MADDAPALPPPTAQGTLSKTPFPHLLLYVLERQLTGSIVLTAPDGEHATILALEGFPSKARTSEGVAYLGPVMVEQGILTEEQLQRSIEPFKAEKRLHGIILRELGMIDEARLLEGLRVQVIRKLEHLFGWPGETTFVYYDAFDALSEFGADDMVSVDPLPLVWAAVRHSPPWDHIHGALTKVAGAPLRISPVAQLERLALSDDERLFVDGLGRRPKRLHEMSSAGTLNPTVKQLLLYCLIITKQLEMTVDETASAPVPAAPRSIPPPVPTSAQSAAALARVQLSSRQIAKGAIVEERAPGVRRRDGRASSPTLEPVKTASLEAAIADAMQGHGSPAPASVPAQVVAPKNALAPPPIPQSTGKQPAPAPSQPAVLTEEMAAMRQRILDRSTQIIGQDYFQMLGVGREATKEEVQAAFFALAKVWHPDRLPQQLNDVRDQCGTVFAHLSEAHQTLADQERRGHYMTLMKEGGATPADQKEITDILEAATNFQKAEICLKRNDIVQAESFCRRAQAADPKQPEYIALLAWLEAMKPENQSPQSTLDKIALLDRAIAMNEKCERAYFYRGMLHKRMQNEKSAYKDFKVSAELNPRNIDSVREVRLHNMRRGNSASGKPSAPPPGRSLSDAPPASRRPKPESGGGGGIFGKLFKK